MSTGQGTTKASERKLGRSFARLWVGFSLASAGDGLAYGAVPLLAVAVDPRPVAVAGVVAADGLPWLLAALPAGAFADRFERGHVMAIANVFRAVLLAMVAALLITHGISLALLILAVLGNGCGRAVYYSALQASVPDLVDGRDLDRANGVLTGTEAAAEHLGGPVLGTLAFAAARALPFIAEGVMIGVSSLPLLDVQSPPAPVAMATEQGAAPEGSPVPDGIPLPGIPDSLTVPSPSPLSAWAGARHLFRNRRLRLLLGLVAGLAFLQGLVGGVLVLVATRDWGVHASGYGLFVASGAVGNLPGALLANRIVARIGSSVSLVLAAVVAAAGYLVMAAVDSWLIAGAAFAVAGFAIGVGIVVSNTMRQRLAPPELMGRVGSAWRGIAWGAAPLGSLAGGAIALVGGLRLPLVVAGCAQLALAAAMAPSLVRGLGGSRGGAVA